jgi:MraZ protein
LWVKTVPLLYGQYGLSKDSKNRLGIPAEVRRGMDPDTDGRAFFVVTGDNGKLWLYTEKAYEAMGKQRPPELAPPDERLDFDHLHYALSEKVEWDQQGRILLPAEDVKETGTGNDLMLIGSRDHLEIWNRTDWEQHRKELRAKRKEISLRGKQSGTDQGVQGT